MIDLCREFKISRKTGYKFWNRYKQGGPEALGDYSKRSVRHPNKTSNEVQELILAIKKKRPTWGPKKLRVVLIEQNPGIRIPAASTIGEVLDRAGKVKKRRQRKRCSPTPRDELTRAKAPNEVWCADFKGQFRMKNQQYCYPLTITDQWSRFIIACDALENTRTQGAYPVFAKAFEQYGMPKVIRTDNGTPFSSTGLHGLSRLSVWWKRLGIRPERIEPGHPEQNGRHERMHLTLKEETTRPSGANLLQQQERFDQFVKIFNEIRPHEGLQMKRPSEVYIPSQRKYPDLLAEPKYPLHDQIKQIQQSGHLQLCTGCRVYISHSLAGEKVGARELESHRWLVSFLDLDLGIIDVKKRHFEVLPPNQGKEV